MTHTINGVPRTFGRDRLPDSRDRRFRVPRRWHQLPPRGRRYWADYRWMGDQEDSPHCVGFSWAHWLQCAPYRQWVEPLGIYKLAQRLDEWEGTDYDGTSVRAGAKALASLGFIGAYHWATDVHEIAETILHTGPVVVGTEWTEGMSSPDAQGIVRPEGTSLGGHAYILTGVNVERRLFRLKNSWGRGWGRRGRALISFDDMQELISADGEACIGVEKKAGPAS